MNNSVVEIIQKEIGFQQEILYKRLIQGIKGKQEWLANNGLDRSGVAPGIIHETWASIVDPYIDNLIKAITELPAELNRDYSNEELDEIEDLLQSNYYGLLNMESTLYKPQIDLPVRSETSTTGKNIRITIGIDKIRLKNKHKRNTLSDEFIIKTFKQQENENRKNNTRFWLTGLLSFIAIVVSVVSLAIKK